MSLLAGRAAQQTISVLFVSPNLQFAESILTLSGVVAIPGLAASLPLQSATHCYPVTYG